MFYNKPNGFRSSVRRGSIQKNNRFHKPFRNNGNFNKPRIARGAHESQLKGRIDIFIKEAKQSLNNLYSYGQHFPYRL